MDELSRPPLTLLHRLAQDDLDNDDLEVLAAMLQATGLAEVPNWVQARASRIMPPTVPEVSRLGEMKHTAVWLAQLIFDSWSTPRLAASRSSDTLARQILLQADTIDISLHVQSTGAPGITVIGQMLGHTGGSAHVWLYRQDHRVTDPLGETTPGHPAAADTAYGPQEVDTIGEFAFKDVRPGQYVLVLQTEAARIESVRLDLTTQPDD